MKFSRLLILAILSIAGCSANDGTLAIGPLRLRSPVVLAVTSTNTLSREFSWTDRRPIVRLVTCEPSLVTPANPGGWLFNLYPGANFAEQMSAYANRSIEVMRSIDAQGMIVWDIDGARYPAAMYVGAPDQAVAMNPELGGRVEDFFARFRSAGFKVGVCIRPCEFNAATGKQEDSPDPFATLLRKAKFARQVWKCRLIYVDSNYGSVARGDLLPATLAARLHKDEALRDVLFIFEAEDRNYYRHSAPWLALENGDDGTPADVLADIPDAFGVININTGDVPKHFDKLVAAVKRGDILITDGWQFFPKVKDVAAIRAAAAAN